jgi:hypothetical protein
MKIFLSYARGDDQSPRKKITHFRKAFEIILSEVIGEKCQIYFDKLSIRWGVEWRNEIERLITDANYFMPVLTPSYFKSRMCIFELQKAFEKDKRILPIYFRTCKMFESSFKEDGLYAKVNKNLNKTSRKVKNIQRKDFRKLRNKKYDSSEVEDFLDAMAEEFA